LSVSAALPHGDQVVAASAVKVQALAPVVEVVLDAGDSGGDERAALHRVVGVGVALFVHPIADIVEDVGVVARAALRMSAPALAVQDVVAALRSVC
jgi:hypothetical protein